MIFIVWMLALAITCPPILGWYEQERRGHIEKYKECRYNENKGYVVFSAMGTYKITFIREGGWTLLKYFLSLVFNLVKLELFFQSQDTSNFQW